MSKLSESNRQSIYNIETYKVNRSSRQYDSKRALTSKNKLSQNSIGILFIIAGIVSVLLLSILLNLNPIALFITSLGGVFMGFGLGYCDFE